MDVSGLLELGHHDSARHRRTPGLWQNLNVPAVWFHCCPPSSTLTTKIDEFLTLYHKRNRDILEFCLWGTLPIPALGAQFRLRYRVSRRDTRHLLFTNFRAI